MLKLVIDEDMPRSTARALRIKDYEAFDVRDVGLREKTTMRYLNAYSGDSSHTVRLIAVGHSGIPASHSGSFQPPVPIDSVWLYSCQVGEPVDSVQIFRGTKEKSMTDNAFGPAKLSRRRRFRSNPIYFRR